MTEDVCATAGGAGWDGAGNPGSGNARLGPGDPVPGTSGAGAMLCGAIKLLVCDNAGTGAPSAISTAAVGAAQRRNVP